MSALPDGKNIHLSPLTRTAAYAFEAIFIMNCCEHRQNARRIPAPVADLHDRDSFATKLRLWSLKKFARGHVEVLHPHACRASAVEGIRRASVWPAANVQMISGAESAEFRLYPGAVDHLQIATAVQRVKLSPGP